MEKIIQFIKFGLVGASNTIISLAIYYILIYSNTNYIIASILSYICASISGYFLNKIWVFKAKTKSGSSLIKYYVVYGSSFILNILLMYIFVDILAISQIISPIICMFFTIPYNFILSKLWAFKT